MDIGLLLPERPLGQNSQKALWLQKVSNSRLDHANSLNEIKLTSLKKTLQKEHFRFRVCGCEIYTYRCMGEMGVFTDLYVGCHPLPISLILSLGH